MMARSERLMFPLCNERVEMEKRILWGVILGVVVYAILGLVTDAREVASVLIEFPYLVFLGALGLTVVNYSVRFAKWHYYLRLLGLKVPVGLSLNVFLAGLVMSVTPGKLGEVLKSLLLREAQQIPAARTAPIVIAERLTDLLGLFVIAALGVGTFAFGRWAFAISVVVVVSAIIVLNQPKLIAWMLTIIVKLPVVGKLHDKLEEAYESMRQLVGWKALTVTTLMSVISWSMEGVAFYWIITALGGGGSVLDALFIFSMTTILGAVSFLPGGLGVTEGGMIGGLMLLGVFSTRAPAGAATYLIRFATLWFGVLVGFIALVRFRRVYGSVDALIEAEPASEAEELASTDTPS